MADVSSTHPRWTIMLYLSGDNNLSSAMIDAINAIGATKLPSWLRITIQFDPSATRFPTLRYVFTRERQEQIKKDAAAQSPSVVPMAGARVNPPEPEHWPENSATPEALAGFIEWSLKEPTDYRMLILSGHGSGAVGDFLPDKTAGGGESGALTIPQLHRALRLAAKGVPHRRNNPDLLLDILGMDTCLMSMAEVCYQVRGFARYLVASEGFVPNFGWPYRHLLERLCERTAPDLEPAVLSSHIVADYIGYYSDHVSADVSVDIASCDLDQHEPLRSSLRELTTTLTEHVRTDPVARDLIVVAHWRAQSFKYEQYTDLWDFCTQLKEVCDKHGRLSQVGKLCERVATRVEAMVGGPSSPRQNFVGVDFQHTHGLSIYFPWSHPGSTAFANYRMVTTRREADKRTSAPGDDDGWADFLQAYLKATKRETRPVPGKAETIPGPIAAPELLPSDEPSAYRNSPGYNKNSPGYNRLLEALGTPLPGSMKNPPTEVQVPVSGSLSGVIDLSMR